MKYVKEFRHVWPILAKYFFVLVQLHRCHLEKTDLWTSLQRNWDLYYWLTGEIPATLEALYDNLIQHYGHRITRGKCVLSFRNQVQTYRLVLRSNDDLS